MGLVWGVVVALLVGFAQLLLETPPLLLAAALLPAAATAALAVRLDRRAHRAWQLLLAAFLWGAVVAPVLAAALNRGLRALLTGQVADAQRLTAGVGAPVIEEGAKALALFALALVWRHALRDVRAGIVFGALVGLGFALTENLTYFAAATVMRGAEGLAEAVYLRAALGALLHPTFSACAGAGLGWAASTGRPTRRIAAALAGLLAAVAAHALWNGIGAPWLYTTACAPGAAAACAIEGRLRYWLLTAPAITLLCLAPPLLALGLLLRAQRGRRAESRA